MELKEVLNGIDFELLQGDMQQEINKIVYDSRNVEAGDLFICIEGFAADGHKYIRSAFEKGAKVIVCQRMVEDLPPCIVLRVKDTRKALASLAANYYHHPEKQLKIIGITGTNGKTTSTYMMKSILEEAGFKVGLIGTIANYIGEKRIPSHRTTPESLELQQLFREMVEEKVQYCVMEVSSHSLELDRVYGIKFAEGIFTNLTRDHLDFHKTFENYFNAKMKLFISSSNTIINVDDEYGLRVQTESQGTQLTYGIEREADVTASAITMHAKGVDFALRYDSKSIPIQLNLPGRYNIYNALGSAAACLHQGIPLEIVQKSLRKVLVPGRCEIVRKDQQLGYEVIIDYAHTPDGLENILKTAREFTKGRLISVFGCGGDRDKTKRPLMGEIGSQLSDIAVITSDNPRSEDPNLIIDDIVAGIKENNYSIIPDRRDAIKEAMKMAQKDDVIVVAGKGHEDYQILKDKVIPFDEREVIAEIIKELYEDGTYHL